MLASTAIAYRQSQKERWHRSCSALLGKKEKGRSGMSFFHMAIARRPGFMLGV